MPGYGVLPADEGSGLLPWAEAERRLTVAHDYWCATVRPDGAPHVMPVWGVWLDARLWFSSGLRSRKARNLAADPRCTLTTDDARDPVVLEGVAQRATAGEELAAFLAAVDAKYAAGLTAEFLDPAVNGTYAVRPVRAFALRGEDFAGSPTRWRFPPG
jgi:pyridoxine/pyridoxamine 5'-phosphate oxidase